MGASKTELFSEYHNRLAGMAKALAHPARIAILELLVKKGTCVCGDLVDELPLSQATVSQHLKAMKNAGILKGEVYGPYRCYCVDMKQCNNLRNSIEQLFSKLDTCC
ncbi:MAG: metalloregulator ArsR/SmtB family transcription factor [Bacteroidia bacterium]|nr:metalloregulator ArsR/SmtB family transcription factor [Bacteroidia bacterium]